MDPTAELCRVRDSLLERDPVFLENKLPEPYVGEISTIAFTPGIEYEGKEFVPAPNPDYVNVTNYKALQQAKDSYAQYNAQPTPPQGGLAARSVQSRKRELTPFEVAIRSTNPFEDVGGGLFIDRAGVKLANIDALYRVTADVTTFVDVAGGPGAWTQYMQWRAPEAKGFGITLRRDPRLDWNVRAISPETFQPIYGRDDASGGDLFVEWALFASRVRTLETNGVRLTLADGGAEVADLSRQEYLLSPLILVEALTCLSVGSIGSTMVLKLFDTVTDLSAQLLYLLSLCYQELSIFKPLSSRPSNSERYLIARALREPSHVQPVIQLLQETMKGLNPESRLPISLIQDPLPESFLRWLAGNNALSLRGQIQAAQRILRYLQAPSPEQELRDQYDRSRILVVWGLPTDPLPSTVRTREPRGPRPAYSLPTTVPLTSQPTPRRIGASIPITRVSQPSRGRGFRGRGRRGPRGTQPAFRPV